MIVFLNGPRSPQFSIRKVLLTERAKPKARRFRTECLNAYGFMNLEDARSKMEDWRRYYNEERPHGAIGNKTPITLHNHDGAASPPS